MTYNKKSVEVNSPDKQKQFAVDGVIVALTFSKNYATPKSFLLPFYFRRPSDFIMHGKSFDAWQGI